jgi:hypothetical protein
MFCVSQTTPHAVVSAPQYESPSEPTNGRDPRASDVVVACRNCARSARADRIRFSRTPAYSVPAKGVVAEVELKFSKFHNLLTIFKHCCDNSEPSNGLFDVLGGVSPAAPHAADRETFRGRDDFGTFYARA